MKLVFVRIFQHVVANNMILTSELYYYYFISKFSIILKGKHLVNKSNTYVISHTPESMLQSFVAFFDSDFNRKNDNHENDILTVEFTG